MARRSSRMPSCSSSMARAAVGLALATGAGCGNSVFYYPDSMVRDDPSTHGVAFDDVAFESLDGTRLHGWFLPARGVATPLDAHGTVVHLHGNAENLTSHWTQSAWLLDRGFNVFIFDYRGYGASEGTPSPRGLVDDSRAALAYVRSRADVDPTRLLVLGQSLGGATAIATVGGGEREGVRAVVIDSTFSTYSSIADDKLPLAGLSMSNEFSPQRFVAAISPIPILFLHGDADRAISVRHAMRLHAAAVEPKCLVVVAGAGHLEVLGPRVDSEVRDLLVAFCLDALTATPTTPVGCDTAPASAASAPTAPAPRAQ